MRECIMGKTIIFKDKKISHLSIMDKQVVEKIFKTDWGYVLDFTNKTFEIFFKNELNVNILEDKYCAFWWKYHSSKWKRFKKFLEIEWNILVGKLFEKLIEYIETKIILWNFNKNDYQREQILYIKKLSKKLIKDDLDKSINKSKINPNIWFINWNINIILNKDIFSHVYSLLDSWHYFNAVEESYKIVRKKLWINFLKYSKWWFRKRFLWMS